MIEEAEIKKYYVVEENEAWARYEAKKAELPLNLSPREYQIACEQIADELGI